MAKTGARNRNQVIILEPRARGGGQPHMQPGTSGKVSQFEGVAKKYFSKISFRNNLSECLASYQVQNRGYFRLTTHLWTTTISFEARIFTGSPSPLFLVFLPYDCLLRGPAGRRALLARFLRLLKSFRSPNAAVPVCLVYVASYNGCYGDSQQRRFRPPQDRRAPGKGWSRASGETDKIIKGWEEHFNCREQRLREGTERRAAKEA